VETPLTAAAHIGPPASQLSEFRIFGRPGREHQGLYFYRNDRLLQIGGWNGIAYAKRDYELGRVAIDVRDDFQRFVKINPEKSGLVLEPAFEDALLKATFDHGSGGFPDYLTDVETQCRRSRARQRRPVKLVEPGFGIPGEVIDAIDETVQVVDDVEPVEIRWRALAPDQVFEIALDERRLYLNARMREVLVGHRSRDPDDAPVLKVLFHLLMSRMFEGTFHGASQRQDLEAWQEILSAAVRAQGDAMARREKA
jgi:hypothetical protein